MHMLAFILSTGVYIASIGFLFREMLGASSSEAQWGMSTMMTVIRWVMLGTQILLVMQALHALRRSSVQAPAGVERLERHWRIAALGCVLIGLYHHVGFHPANNLWLALGPALDAFVIAMMWVYCSKVCPILQQVNMLIQRNGGETTS